MTDVDEVVSELALYGVPRNVPWQAKEGAWNKLMAYLGLEVKAEWNHGNILVSGANKRHVKEAQAVVTAVQSSFRDVEATAKRNNGRLDTTPIMTSVQKCKAERGKR